MTRNPVVVVVTILEDTVLQVMVIIILEKGLSYHIDDRKDDNTHYYHEHREDNAECLHHCVCSHFVKVDHSEHDQWLVLLKYKAQREPPEEFFVHPG
jgi:hypothetical protein